MDLPTPYPVPILIHRTDVQDSGDPTSREHRAGDGAPGSLHLCHHHCMPNDDPKKSEGKFSEVARKSREKRAAMEQQKRDEDAVFPERGSNGGADVKDS